jgi:hypothetical protein
VEKRAKVTRLVLEHVERADDAVKNFRDNVVSADGRAEFLRYQRLPLTYCGAAGVDIRYFPNLGSTAVSCGHGRPTNQK